MCAAGEHTTVLKTSLVDRPQLPVSLGTCFHLFSRLDKTNSASVTCEQCPHSPSGQKLDQKNDTSLFANHEANATRMLACCGNAICGSKRLTISVRQQ